MSNHDKPEPFYRPMTTNIADVAFFELVSANSQAPGGDAGDNSNCVNVSGEDPPVVLPVPETPLTVGRQFASGYYSKIVRGTTQSKVL